jgi:Kef-type K+ transport system membrane component KefB
MVMIFGIPRLSRHVRLPAVVGLLLSGVVVGPHVLGIFGEQRPIADFLADLGKLLLMFVAGLEIDLAHFRQAQARFMIFGLITTGIPLLLGTAVSLLFGYGLIAAIVVALVARKGIAAELVGRAFQYTPAARLTMWSLTLPQVAATLAATLVAFNTFDPVGQRLIDRRLLDVVLVLMLTTAKLGPMLTQQFAPRMLEDPSR